MNTKKKLPIPETENPIPDLSEESPIATAPLPKRSRLQHTLEMNSKKTLLLSLLGIIILVALLIIFGVPALVKFAELTGKRDDVTVSEEEERVLVLQPSFEEERIATNSAEITIRGTADEGETVKLYKDGKLLDDVKASEDNSFTFKKVSLKEGANAFKVKAFKKDDESKFSEPLTITYRKDAPKLFIDYPTDGQGISNKDGDRLQVEGSTNPDMTVTINGTQVIVDDEGKFKHFIPLAGGENTIKAVATDEAGNKTELERKFTYNR